jgi:hypothetical protein
MINLKFKCGKIIFQTTANPPEGIAAKVGWFVVV